jgi:hypothetical protein
MLKMRKLLRAVTGAVLADDLVLQEHPNIEQINAGYYVICYLKE